MSFYKDGKKVLSNLDRYYNQSINKEKKVIRQRTISELHEKLELAAHLKNGDLSDERLDAFIKEYLDNTTRLHHPGYFAHQVGVPHPTGALGSLIDGFTNNAMAIYEMGPAAAAIEFFMVNYLLEKIGWKPMPTDINKRLTFFHGSGVLTHGGSLANMTALLTARNHLDSSVREQGNPSDLVILAPETSHYSVANACSTGTGLYDPIDEIADFCSEKKIWFHVDGAHGGGAFFSKKYNHCLKGIQKADSMIIDAHKMLRTPSICAALLVKNAVALDHTFEHKASYLFHEKKQPGFDFIGQVIECTKSGLGLKFYMTLAAIGEKGIENYFDTAYDLTQQAFEYISTQPDFEVPCKPESNILCFKFNADDDVQIMLRDHLIEQGNFYISCTELNAKRYLRIVIMNPESRLNDIKDLVTSIRQAFAAHYSK